MTTAEMRQQRDELVELRHKLATIRRVVEVCHRLAKADVRDAERRVSEDPNDRMLAHHQGLCGGALNAYTQILKELNRDQNGDQP